MCTEQASRTARATDADRARGPEGLRPADRRPPSSAERMSEDHQVWPSSVAAGMRGKCPRCGQGDLFRGFLTVRPRCDACGLDFSFADAGDGPAVFVIFFAGFIVVFIALAVEFAYQPPFWLHALLWGPLILLVTLGPLRPLKGLMIALQYRNEAAEGQIDRGGDA